MLIVAAYVDDCLIAYETKLDHESFFQQVGTEYGFSTWIPNAHSVFPSFWKIRMAIIQSTNSGTFAN